MFAAPTKPGAVLAALLAAAAVGSAQAVVVPTCTDLGTLGAPGANDSATFGATRGVGSFLDSYCFTLASPHSVAASITNVFMTFGAASYGEVGGFASALGGGSLTPSTTLVSPMTVQLLAGSWVLGAGTYYLGVSGSVGSGTASYGGNIAVTSVPELETYALMLAGLGVIGFLSVRRRRDD